MVNKILRIEVILLAVSLLSGCNDEKLLNNLTQEQANQVLAILQQHNISSQKQGTLKVGYSISVSPSESTAALSIINQYQLPWGAEVQIGQAFPESSLVTSPNAEQARVLSLQEQRLEQSLRIIAQVVNTRVHISYSPFNNDISSKKPPRHVGILISYKGEIDENTFISQIKSLIKNSLNDVRYENISVVLFPAPVIQYSSPIEVPSSTADLWLIFFVIIVFCAAATGGYVLYKSSRRLTVGQDTNQNRQQEELPER